MHSNEFLRDRESDLIEMREQLLSRFDNNDCPLNSSGEFDDGDLDLMTCSVTELGELDRIDNAIGRIATGDYGKCSSCNSAIYSERLVELPTVSTCVECQRMQSHWSQT